jgi:hypothetical protein
MRAPLGLSSWPVTSTLASKWQSNSFPEAVQSTSMLVMPSRTVVVCLARACTCCKALTVRARARVCVCVCARARAHRSRIVGPAGRGQGMGKFLKICVLKKRFWFLTVLHFVTFFSFWVAAREIVNHSNFCHPHVIQFKEVFLTDDYLAIAMEYAPGGDLFQYVRDHGGLRVIALPPPPKRPILGLEVLCFSGARCGRKYMRLWREGQGALGLRAFA